MRKKDIYILGVGNNTEVYIDLVEECGYNPAGLYHYEQGREGHLIHSVPVLDCNENLFKEDLTGRHFTVSVGNNKVRAELVARITSLGGIIPTLVHPTAVVSKYAKLEEQVVVHANSVIQAGASIGKNTVISYNVSVTHTTAIGKNCYIAAGGNVGAYITVQNEVMIGQGAVL